MTDADVMKVATGAWYERITPQPTVHGKLEEFARALTEYGNERAREGNESADFWRKAQAETAAERDEARAEITRLREARAVNEFIVEYGERRACEARAVAIAQCKAIAREHQAPSVVRAIADLALTPPLGAAEHARSDGQSAGGEG